MKSEDTKRAVKFRVENSDFLLIQQAAKDCGRNPTDFSRLAAIYAAKRIKELVESDSNDEKSFGPFKAVN